MPTSSLCLILYCSLHSLPLAYLPRASRPMAMPMFLAWYLEKAHYTPLSQCNSQFDKQWLVENIHYAPYPLHMYVKFNIAFSLHLKAKFNDWLRSPPRDHFTFASSVSQLFLLFDILTHSDPQRAAVFGLASNSIFLAFDVSWSYVSLWGITFPFLMLHNNIVWWL